MHWFACWLLLLSVGVVRAEPVLVSAAASLTEVLTSLGPQSADAELKYNFGATGALERQLEQGAQVDLFLGAAPENLARLASAGLVTTGSVRVWCHNRLALLARAELAAHLRPAAGATTWSVLRDPAVRRIALGEPRSVPAGMYARRLLEREQLWAPLQAKLVFADNVRQALAWVERGEVDAAFVYATDAATARAARLLGATRAEELPIAYALALTPRGAARPAARAVYHRLTGPEGAAALRRFGFAPAMP